MDVHLFSMPFLSFEGFKFCFVSMMQARLRISFYNLCVTTIYSLDLQNEKILEVRNYNSTKDVGRKLKKV